MNLYLGLSVLFARTICLFVLTYREENPKKLRKKDKNQGKE
jgi:hypothetical protein